MPTVDLVNRVQPYAWGSRHLLADLRGEQPSVGPEAEVWMGAHPAAPSRLRTDGGLVGLDRAIETDPSLVGEEVLAAHGGLPYLLKLLAADEPLSLQAHPDRERARRGYEREEAAGIPIDAPHRNYKDPNHKPELICALTPFRALSGFRPVEATVELFEGLACGELGPIVDRLRGATAADLVDVVEHVLTLDTGQARRLGAAVATAAREDGPDQAERDVARRIAEVHPDDPGIVIALMLELVTLAPGEAMYLGAGRLHAYVDGLGVEIMAASDNVLRGGLTPKHVDVAELVEVLAPVVEPIEVLAGRPAGDGELEYPTPAPEFLLSRIEVAGPVTRCARGPEILVATHGEVILDSRRLAPGDARFAPAGSTWSVTGSGRMFRARVGGGLG